MNADAWDDQPLPEDAAIEAAHPTQTGQHELYAEAMRLVGARRSKGGLVELVNWLLYREHQACETAVAPNEALLAAREHLRSVLGWLGNYRECRDCDGKPEWREGPIVHEGGCAMGDAMAAARVWLDGLEKRTT